MWNKKKRWEGEIEGAGACIVRWYYFASLFLFRFFWRQKKNEIRLRSKRISEPSNTKGEQLLIIIIILINTSTLIAQPNCAYYKMIGDDCLAEACEIAVTPSGGQGSRSSQENLDKAIAKCPRLAYAYKVKSIPYLKRGYFIEWKKLMDLAVQHEPEGYLGYRGWCRYQFLKDYQGAINDFTRLESLISDLGYSANGHYHLMIAKGICQSALGQHEAGIRSILSKVEDPDYYIGPYDLLHLGMMYLELDDHTNAIKYLERQLEYDINADTYYYLSLAYYKVRLLEKAKEVLELSKKQYGLTNYRSDPYGETDGRIYQEDIDALETVLNN